MILDERELCLKLREYRENIHAMMSDLYDLELTLEDRGIGECCQVACSVSGISLNITAEFIDEILEDMERDVTAEYIDEIPEDMGAKE